MKAAIAASAMLACFFAGSIYAPIDYERNQRAADLAQKRRLINHYPAAEFTAPINEGMK